MLKVMHVITGLQVGGAELMLTRLLARFDRTRIRSVTVCLATGPLEADFTATGTPLFTLGMSRGLPDPRAFARLCALIDRERPDVVQTWLYHADLLGLLAAKYKRVGAVGWNVRCSDILIERASALDMPLRWALAALSPVPDLVIVNSQSGKAAHERMGYRPRRWAVIPNGVDTGRFRPDPAARASRRASLGIDHDAPVIGMVARFDPMKDYRSFFEAARLFGVRRPEARFVIAGGGADAQNPLMRQWFSELGIDPTRFSLLGAARAIETLLPSFDVFSLSSAYGEGFSNALAEAMAAGVPCVATDVGDARWLIGDTGRVVPPRSPAALANAWDELVSLDGAARGSLAAGARERIERDFTIDRITGLYADVFAELGEVARARRRGRPRGEPS
jgi:glycosyltransferase involved in cell wall biosynthesis